jgi:hypothetical protein
MEKKKAIDLIKLEVLGCIKKEDAENLRLAKENDQDFPFKELGEYQNLVALIPLALELEYPDSELKDKTALKLYSIRDEIKAKLDAKKALEKPPVEAVPEENAELEETVEEELKTSEDYELKSTELLKTEFLDQTKSKEIPEEDLPSVEPRPKQIKDKELIEKTVKDNIKVFLESEVQPLKETINRNLMLSFGFFAVTLVLIILLFIIK